MKKNSVLDGMLWLVYSVTVIFSFCYFSAAAAVHMGYRAPAGLIAAGVVLLIAALLNALVRGLLSKRRARAASRIKPAVAEGIALTVLMAGALTIRLLTFGQTAVGDCYEAAKVVSDGAYEPEVTNGALNLYLRLLHGVLWIFGNTEAAVRGLQLVLALLLILVYYGGVRRLCGTVAGLLAAALLGASCLLGERLGADTPDALFCLVCFLGFWCVVTWWDGWNRSRKQRSLPMALGRCAVTGGLIGLGIYMDAAAAVLASLLVCVLLGGRQKAEEGTPDTVRGFWNLRPVSFLLLLVFGLAVYIGLFYLFVQSPAEWLAQYDRFALTLPVWLTVSFQEPWEWELLIVTGLMALGVFTEWNRRGTADSGLLGRAGTLLCALLLIGMQGCGILTDAPTDSYLLLYLFLLMLAGMSVADLFAAERQPAEETIAQEPESKTEQPKETPEPVGAKKPETVNEPEPEKPKEPAQPRFLESPLPLPKKHVHKTMDYDIEVAEDDDYDI